MNIIITKNYEELSDKAFDIIIDIIKNNPNAILGLATGSSPLGIYKRMINDYKINNTTYQNIKTINLDEYIGLDINDKQSYAYFMKENLFKYIDIKNENTYIQNGKALNSIDECKKYNNLLHNMQQDLQLLGIGSDGHIGFNEPGTPFDTETHIAELSDSTIKDNSRLFNNINEVPRFAYTMGLKNIMNAKKILIIANGKNKANAIKKLINEDISTFMPASILKLHNNCTLIIDEEAASLL